MLSFHDFFSYFLFMLSLHDFFHTFFYDHSITFLNIFILNYSNLNQL